MTIRVPAPFESLQRSLARPGFRLAVLTVCGLLAVYLGFIGIGVKLADDWVKRGAYYVVLSTFLLWLWTLWRTRAALRATPPLTAVDRRLAVVAIAVITLVALTTEQFNSKVLYDEFVLQSTAFNMHFFRDASTMVRGYDVFGLFVSTDNFMDKRPFFYPFLVSLLHDLTGYRPLNAYALNAALFPLTLGLLHFVARLLTDARGALLAVLLAGTLPLLAQNATGSGMELLNVAMLLAVMALAMIYLQQPEENRLSALVIGTVLLAQSRYESGLYVLIVAGVILIGWMRTQRIILSGPAMLSPLLLLPFAWQQKVVSQMPAMWELGEHQTSRFSVDYLAGNLSGAAGFFFSRSPLLANSSLVAVLGVVALGGVIGLGALRWKRWRELTASEWAALLFGAGIVANTVLIMFYYWASFSDSMASRFSLPLHLGFILAAVYLAVRSRWRWLMPSLALACGMYFLGSVIPRQRAHHYSHLGIDEIEWEHRFVASLPPGERLIVTNKSTIPWLVRKTPSILIDRAKLVPDRLRYQLTQPTFREILVMQSLRPSTREGQHQLLPEEILPANFVLETIVEKRFGTKIDRISRLVAVGPDLSAAESGASDGPSVKPGS